MYTCIIIFQQVHNMLQCLVHNNYACLQVLVNNVIIWQGSCVVANNAQKTIKDSNFSNAILTFVYIYVIKKSLLQEDFSVKPSKLLNMH